MAKKNNLFSRAAAFRKTPAGRHMTQTEAVQHLSADSHKVAGKKKATAKKKIGSKKIAGKSVGKRNVEFVVLPGKKTSYRVKPGGPTARAMKIQREIDKLENQRSQQKSKQVKDVFSLAINEKHKQLRDIQKQLRTRI